MTRPKPLSFELPYEPIPAMAGPKPPAPYREDYRPGLAMQEAIRRSERHPKALNMSSRVRSHPLEDFKR